MTAETIEQWAARVAPTLGAKGWEALNKGHGAVSMDGEFVTHRFRGGLTDRGRALLAYRDARISGLFHQQKEAFLRGEPQAAMGFEHLQRVDILDDHGDFTDFGREVARALREGE